jgi:hypothetical protein
MFVDPAATEHEKANAKELKGRLKKQFGHEAKPEETWTRIMFRLGQGVKEITSPPSPRPVGQITLFDLAECSVELSRGSDKNKERGQGAGAFPTPTPSPKTPEDGEGGRRRPVDISAAFQCRRNSIEATFDHGITHLRCHRVRGVAQRAALFRRQQSHRLIRRVGETR